MSHSDGDRARHRRLLNKPGKMAFRDDVFKQAGGRCQCIMKACSDHTGRCNAMLRGDWEMHRTTAGEAYTLSSVKAMCQTCHRKTPTYGRGKQ
jgi:hypothetical protein